MKSQLLTVAVIALLISNTFQDKLQIDDDFENYMKSHGKKYANSDEKAYRSRIFADSVADVKTHNADPSNTYTKAINDFSDMTVEEFTSNIFFLFRNSVNAGYS
jgi:hypothetical protein